MTLHLRAIIKPKLKADTYALRQEQIRVRKDLEATRAKSKLGKRLRRSIPLGIRD